MAFVPSSNTTCRIDFTLEGLNKVILLIIKIIAEAYKIISTWIYQNNSSTDNSRTINAEMERHRIYPASAKPCLRAAPKVSTRN